MRAAAGRETRQDRLAIWRQAVDAAVNDVLEQSGLACPDEGITPAKLGLPRNKTAEEYFDLLLERNGRKGKAATADKRKQEPGDEQGQDEQAGDADESDPESARAMERARATGKASDDGIGDDADTRSGARGRHRKAASRQWRR